MKRIISTVALAFLAFVGVAAAGDEVAGVRKAYEAAVTAGDAAKVAALYTADGIEMPPDHALVKGRAAIEAFNKELFGMAAAKLAITSMESEAVGSVAYDAGTYTQELAMKAGGTITESGKYVVVMKKDTTGAWHIAYLAYNRNEPMPAAPAAAVAAPVAPKK